MRTKLITFVLLLSIVSLIGCGGNTANTTSPAATSAEASTEADDSVEEAEPSEEEKKAAEEEAKKKAEEEAARQAAEEEARKAEEQKQQEEFNKKIADVDYMRTEVVAIAEDLGYVLGDEGRSEVDGSYLFWLYPPTDDDNGHLATLVALVEHEDYRNFMACSTWLTMENGMNYRDVFTLEELRDYLDQYALFKDDRMQQWQENEAAASELNDQLMDTDYLKDLISDNAEKMGYTSVEVDQEKNTGDTMLWIYVPENPYGFSKVSAVMHAGVDDWHSAENNYCEMTAYFDNGDPIRYGRHCYTPQGMIDYLEDYTAVFR